MDRAGGSRQPSPRTRQQWPPNQVRLLPDGAMESEAGGVRGRSTCLQQLVWAVCCTNAELLQQLQHQPGETLEGTGYPDLRIDLDQHVLGRVNVEALCVYVSVSKCRRGSSGIARRWNKHALSRAPQQQESGQVVGVSQILGSRSSIP